MIIEKFHGYNNEFKLQCLTLPLVFEMCALQLL
jgi:hypothetical protein